jgi:sulfoxide reductase catalytic subunit YedY
MHIRRTPAWAIPEHEATPEDVFLNRRALLAGGLGAGAVLAAGDARAQWFSSGPADLTREPDPTDDLYPARNNPAFTLDRPMTEEQVAATYNNFYEFGSSKTIWRQAQALKTRPWVVKIDGLVETPLELGIDDLIRRMQIEERLYRLRCVEAWAMAVPWTGFPLKALVDLARPSAGARYVRFETFQNPAIAPGQKQGWYPWPYTEGVTLAEATNDLAFMVTGVYGKPLRKQFGAPLRLALPWKYGFKSVKSIQRISFTAERPVSFWEKLQPSEYGFWANVNPQVNHPRWSQASETLIGTSERRPTQLFNGYAPLVADLYRGLEGERLWG